VTAWILVAAGVLLAAVGMMSAVAAAAVRRVDLYRWATDGKPGGAAAGTLLAAPGRIVRAAQGLVTGGSLLTGFGLAALAADLPQSSWWQSRRWRWCAMRCRAWPDGAGPRESCGA
jgi:hypothetical protein